MADLFDALGFTIQDEAAYQKLAEEAYRRGKPSAIYRHSAIIQGFCWALGDGIEIWTVTYEAKEGRYYADCRPAFRSTREFQCTDWEIIEFLEDGEVMVSGRIQTVPLIFELQNFTVLDESTYQTPVLSTTLSGLCYSAKVSPTPLNQRIYSLCESKSTRTPSKYAENDYLIQGKVHSWRVIHNPLTQAGLLKIEIEAAGLLIELIVNQAHCQGELSLNAWVTVEAWLQGYLISHQQQRTRFEGVDFSTSPADLWAILRREN